MNRQFEKLIGAGIVISLMAMKADAQQIESSPSSPTREKLAIKERLSADTPFSSVDNMHSQLVEQFVQSQGFGASRIARPKHLLGLTRGVVIDNEMFSIKALDLVGVAGHDPPVVHLQFEHLEMIVSSMQEEKDLFHHT